MDLTAEVLVLCQRLLAQQGELLEALQALVHLPQETPLVAQYGCTMHYTSAVTVFVQGLSPAQASDVLQQMARPPEAPDAEV